jgi:hypothetical protein
MGRFAAAAAQVSHDLGDRPGRLPARGPQDLMARRVCDLIPPDARRSHRVYSDVFVPLAAEHQLTIMLALTGSSTRPPSTGFRGC